MYFKSGAVREQKSGDPWLTFPLPKSTIHGLPALIRSGSDRRFTSHYRNMYMQ